MKKLYIRKRWFPTAIVAVLSVIYAVFLIRTALDHLDRLTPDWNGLSRTLPFFAYAGILIAVLGLATTHIQVGSQAVTRYYSPLPFKERLSIPLNEIEQVLFWQTSLGPFSVYGLGLQTKSGKKILHELFRTREEVFLEVKRIADTLGARGLTTVKVAETRAAVAPAAFGNPWVYLAALVLFLVFYRIARF